MTRPIQDILVLLPMQDHHRDMLLKVAPAARVRRLKPQELTAQDLAQADVIVGNLDAEHLRQVQNAQLLQLNSAGVPTYYLQLAQALPHAVLCCASGAYGEAIAEHALAMLLMLMKRLHQYRDDQKQGAWNDHGMVPTLGGLRVLVVGLGDIGGRFARLCHLLGMTVRGIRRRPSAPPEGVEAVYTQDSLMEQLGWADVVLLSLPDTQDTRALMGREQFQAMKRESYVLNVGRGSAIDQDALLWAVQEGIVAGAGLDVTTPEPLPPESPLWQEPNILITPHVSGGLHAQRTHDNIFEIAAHNIAALPDGPFQSRVDFATGYRA